MKQNNATNNNDATNSKKKPASPTYVKTFRRGAVAANIFRRQAAGSGFEYLDFELSRAWKSQASGKEGYSRTFFEKHADQLKEVIDDAVDYIISQCGLQEPDEPATDAMQVP